jgi:hypothetical protein
MLKADHLPDAVEKSPVSLHRLRHFRGAFRPLLLYGRSERRTDRLRFMAGSQDRQSGDEQNSHSLNANNFLLFRERDPAYIVKR